MIPKKTKAIPTKSRIGSKNGRHVTVIKGKYKELFDIKVINYEKRYRLMKKREEKRRLEDDEIDEWCKNRSAAIKERRWLRFMARERLVAAHKKIIKSEERIQEKFKLVAARGIAAHYLLLDLIMESFSKALRDQDFKYRPNFYKPRPDP